MTYNFLRRQLIKMKRLGFIVLLVMASGLFLTSCEKEHECHPLPTGGNTQQNLTREGDGIINSDADDSDANANGESGSGSDSEDDSEFGITDGGRDEDYDKTGKKKKP